MVDMVSVKGLVQSLSTVIHYGYGKSENLYTELSKVTETVRVKSSVQSLSTVIDMVTVKGSVQRLSTVIDMVTVEGLVQSLSTVIDMVTV